MKIHENGDEYTDWGDRTVYWLFSQRFMNWPLPAVAREIGEPLETVKSWANNDAKPSRQALQRLRAKYGREGLSSFVFGEPCRDELNAKIERLSALIIEIAPYLRSSPARMVPRDDSRGLPVGRVQDSRKVKT